MNDILLHAGYKQGYEDGKSEVSSREYIQKQDIHVLETMNRSKAFRISQLEAREKYWEDKIEKLEKEAQQYRNKAIDECIKVVSNNTDYTDSSEVGRNIILELEALKEK